MNSLGSARLQRAGFGILPKRTFPFAQRFSPGFRFFRKSSSSQNAKTSTLQACAPRHFLRHATIL